MDTLLSSHGCFNPTFYLSALPTNPTTPKPCRNSFHTTPRFFSLPTFSTREPGLFLEWHLEVEAVRSEWRFLGEVPGFLEPSVKGDKQIASCRRSEVELIAKEWEGKLFGFLLGKKRPHLISLKKSMISKWNLKSPLEISFHGKDAMVLHFSCDKEKASVLESGPWFFGGRLLVLRPWRRNLKTSDFDTSTIPIWVRLPNLPVEFWSKDSLSRIGSLLGRPLFSDEMTASRKRSSFARICVEISAAKAIPSKVCIDIEGSESFEQTVKAEWIPAACYTCKEFFHDAVSCPLKKKSSTEPPKNSSNGPEKLWMVVQSRKSRKSSKASMIVGESEDTITDFAGSESWQKKSHDQTMVTTNLETEDLATGSVEKIAAEQFEKSDAVPAILVSEDIVFEPFVAATVHTVESFASNEKTDKSDAAHEPFAAEPLFSAVPDFEPTESAVHPFAAEISATLVDKSSLVCHLPTSLANKEGSCQDREFRGITNREIQLPVVGLEKILENGPLDSNPVLNSSNRLDELNIQDLNPNIISPTNPNLSLPTLPSQTKSNEGPPIPSPLSSPKPNSNSPPPCTPSQPKPTITPTHPNSSPTRTHTEPNLTLVSPNLADSSDDSCEEMDFSFPPGFAPDMEDLSTLRELMKEGVSLVPPEHQKEFIRSVDSAKDSEIFDFFQEKFKKNWKPIDDTNYLTFQNVRRSPRIKKKPARLTDLPSSSGLKKGFLK